MPREKVAIVSGAAGGIGRAVAEGFLAAGYAVTGVDRAGEAWAAEGYRQEPLDVRDGAAVAAFGARFPRVDALVNAAGIIRRAAEHDPAVFAEVLDINLTGSMRLATACRPGLAAAKGSVINLASMYAYFGSGLSPGYASSKAGIVQLTKSLAIAWAKDGIRVNAVAPGWIATALARGAMEDPVRNRAILDRTPMGRWGEPEDVAGPVLFLASDAARFVTGVVLPVDGGYSAV